jgi:mono/diheme cytochrome c family protein
MANRPSLGTWEARLSRWGAPVTYVTVVVSVGLLLVSILLRSPDTKSNYQDSPESYHRTALASMSGPDAYQGLSVSLAADPPALYVGAGCAGCHGLHGAGGTVAPPIWTMELSKVTKTLREGGHGMPVFATQRLSDEQVAQLVDYLHGLRKQYPDEPERKPARPGVAASQ